MYQQNFHKKKKSELSVSNVDCNDYSAVSEYFKFEIDQGFSSVNSKTTFEKMVNFRQNQIRDGKLNVVVAKDGDQLIATSVVVLENGTMGKEIKEDEAWAAGTVVTPEKRSAGIGKLMAKEQDRIAREAGKKAMLTTITNTNYPSMRLRMGVGYRLSGVDEREDEVNYNYRKDLTKDDENTVSYKEKVLAGHLKLYQENDGRESMPREILIRPDDVKSVQNALRYGYQGVYLLRPEDFEEPRPIQENLIVFVA